MLALSHRLRIWILHSSLNGFSTGAVGTTDSLGRSALKRTNRQDYYPSHKEKMQEQRNLYLAANSTRIQERKHRYYLKNLDAIKVKQHDYKMANKARIKVKNQLAYQRLRERRRLADEEANGEGTGGGEAVRKRAKKEREYVPRSNYNLSWKSRVAVREFFDRVGNAELHIRDLSDWYRISRPQLCHFGGGGLLEKFKSLHGALAYAYPEYEWDASKFHFRGKRSAQLWLRIQLQNLLPDEAIVEDYLHPELIWASENNRRVELDLWVPTHKLGLEYHGEQHYVDVHSFGPNGTSAMYSQRDIDKRIKCAERGITYVGIPYWWDGCTDSLSSTLHLYLPELFAKTNAPPIPELPPSSFQEDQKRLRTNRSAPNSLETLS